jgi:hypothetical protein
MTRRTAPGRVDLDAVASGLRGASVLVDLGRLVLDHAFGQGPDVRVARQPGFSLGHVDATLVVPRESPEGLAPPVGNSGTGSGDAYRLPGAASIAPTCSEAQYAYVLTLAEGRKAR